MSDYKDDSHAEEITLPEGWSVHESKSHPGRKYYVNKVTGKSQWEVPTKPAYEKKEKERKVRVSHILVKHNKSRNPSSWREKKITRTYDEAMKLIKEYREMIEKGEAEFEEIARKYSDCNSASRGGDLKYFGRGMMQPEFEKASFALEIGEISKPVVTASGIHIIKRTG